MNITSLTVENFKCYKSPVTAEFAPITLIYGENGGGKSTLLQALEVLKKTAPKDSNEHRNVLWKKNAQRNDTGDMMIKLEDGSTMSWDLAASRSEVNTGPGSCDFAENIINSLINIMQRDFPALKKGVLENMDNNIKVLSVMDVLNREIMGSTEARKKYYDIIKSQFKMFSEDGYNFSFNFDLNKAFSEDRDYTVFGKGAVFNYLEQQGIKNRSEVENKFKVFADKFLHCDNFRDSLMAEIGYRESLSCMENTKVFDKLLKSLADIYILSSKLKLHIWAEAHHEEEFGFDCIFQSNPGLMSELESPRVIFGKYIQPFMGEAVVLDSLEKLFKNHLDNQIKSYFSGLSFVDQPRGYAGMLSSPINAKLKRNLTPLLHQMFPDISFDIRTEGEKKDIYIYDDVLDAEVPAVECGFGYSQILPILIALADTDNEVVCISEPESHIHPRLQAGIGSLFLDVYRKSGKQIIAETHSEHIVLRIQRLIRCGEMKPEEVSVLYVSKTPEGSTIKRLHLDEKGRFIDAWPQGFFAERDEELFGGKPA